jgi:hypothetical protein
MSFVRPDLWWIALLAVAAILLARVLLRRRALPFTRVVLLSGSMFRASRARHLPLVLTAVSMGLAAAALMEPVIPLSERQVEAKASTSCS